MQSNQVGQAGIPRATSGTISGMIADFNKQMEALSVTSPTEEMYPSPQQRSSTGHLSSARSSAQSKRGDQHKYNTSSSSLRLTPSNSGIEKAVSPVIEQTLHQQQLLLHQQQQLIELQRDQQEIQKALQDQLKLQTLQTQMQLEQQNKSQTTVPAAKKEVMTIGTSMSMPGTPKLEQYDPKSDFRDRQNNDSRSSGQRRRVSPDGRYSRDSFESPDRKAPMEDGRGPVRRDDRREPRRDERLDSRREERRDDRRDDRREDRRDHRDERRDDRREERMDDRRSYEDPGRRRPRSPEYRDRDRDKDFSPDNSSRFDRRQEYTSRNDQRGSNKKDRRRLPQPTVEEMKGAVEAITSNSVMSRSAPFPRSTSPVLLNKAQLTSIRSLINERMVNLQQPQQTIIPGSSPNILGSGSGMLGSSSLVDHRAVSPGLLITSYPLQVVSPLAGGFRSQSPVSIFLPLLHFSTLNILVLLSMFSLLHAPISFSCLHNLCGYLSFLHISRSISPFLPFPTMLCLVCSSLKEKSD